MADLHFELVTPERLVRSESVFMVVVPGSEGDFGVLAGHAPFMSTLRNGDIAVYRSGFGDSPERIAVEGGFAEVFTGIPGKFVQVEDTVRSFKAVVNGEYDHLPEAAFYMVGGIDEAVAKAEKLAQEA